MIPHALRLYVASYHHRHGVDVTPFLSPRDVTPEEWAGTLDDFEEDREEWVQIDGPFALDTTQEGIPVEVWHDEP